MTDGLHIDLNWQVEDERIVWIARVSNGSQEIDAHTRFGSWVTDDSKEVLPWVKVALQEKRHKIEKEQENEMAQATGDARTQKTTGTDWAAKEQYLPPKDGSVELAQEIYDRGLLYLANRNLHIFGYALSVIVKDGKVRGLSLMQSDDPNGIVFAEDVEIAGRKKFLAGLASGEGE